MMRKVLITLILLVSNYACISQRLFKKNKVIINHTYSSNISGKDTVNCLRLSQAEWDKLSEIDHDIRTRGQNVESYLQQKKSGLSNVDDNDFTRNIIALEELIKINKIPLKTSFYRDEFSFYKKHPVKTQDEIRQEAIAKFYRDQEEKRKKEYEEKRKRDKYNSKIRLRNDSIREAEQKQRNINDSISEINYQIELAEDRERQKLYSQKLKKEQEQKVIQEKNRNENILKKYGNELGELILNRKVKIGWTKKMCIESWGEPQEVNRTTTASIVHEQWVYSLKKYLYFENDILTAIQD